MGATEIFKRPPVKKRTGIIELSSNDSNLSEEEKSNKSISIKFY